MADYLKNLSRDLVNVAAGIMNKTNSPVVEPEVIAESTELEEANKENKAKKSAFRAGQKSHKDDRMDTKAHRSSSYRYKKSPEEYKAEDGKLASQKDAAKDKTAKMKLAAKDRLRSLGKSTKGAVSAFNKGREVAKTPAAKPHPSDEKIANNAQTKKFDGPEYAKHDYFKHSGESRGRFKQMHDTEQHEKIRRKIDDVHSSIRKKLNELEPSYSATREEGSSAIEKAKAHLEKMEKIHKALHESTEVEDFNEVIAETLELVETVVVLFELYGDDDNG